MAVGDTLGLSTQVGLSAWVHPRPFLLYLKPTARCDLRCEICNRWKTPARSEDDLPLEQIQELLVKFRKAGSTVLTLWGGEPTLRRDLHLILAGARSLGYRTSMCSNCNSLARKADRVLPHLDVLLCSLDGHGELHDQVRGVRGLFGRVLRSIREARRHPHCDVKIWATVHSRNLHHIEKLATLARDLDVGIEYFPVSPIGGYNDDIVPSPEAMHDAFTRVADLKRQGYPVRNPDRVIRIMRDGRRFECNFGRIAIHVDHAGNVYSCEDPEGTPIYRWRHHSEFDPEQVYSSETFRHITDTMSRCNRCRLPCVVELSGSLPVALAGMFYRFAGRAV